MASGGAVVAVMVTGSAEEPDVRRLILKVRALAARDHMVGL